MVGSAKRLRLGTRASRLALVQSELVAARLRAGGVQVELKTIVSDGDLRAPDTPIGEGIFVTALQRALVAGEIDLAVHSAKDLPLDEDPQLVIAAYPERADARDALVTRRAARSVDDLAIGATVGTDSPRRAGFLRALRPDLNVIPLHGNVDTRLRRLDAGQADALVLAAAGLDRLGLGSRIAVRLDAASMPPAPAQGALAVQTRRDDHEVLQAVGALDDPAIRMAVVAERALLKAMGGGCRAPVGAVAVTVDGSLALLVGAVTQDGRSKHVLRVAHGVDEADSLARAVSAAAHELKGFVPLRARAVIDTRPDLDAVERAAIEREGFRVLLARADAASKALPEKLVEMGAVVDDVVAYRTTGGPEASRRILMEAMKDPDAEAIMFASGSAVRGIVELAGAKAGIARAMRAVTIGPKTSAVARELGFEVAREARTQDPEGLRTALRLVFDEEVERWVESQLVQPA